MCELVPFTIGIYLLVGYLSGSIPFGLIFGKWAGYGDIRTQGSGNIGATNMLRIAGKKWALATLIVDGLKGALPVVAGSTICLSFGAFALLGAVLGHMFPVWLKFKGGKGVATTLGGFLALNPLIGGAACLVWLSMAVLFRYSSLAALIAVAIAPVLLLFMSESTNDVVLFIAFAISAFVWLKHYENIGRLLKGEEPKIGRKKA